jgi:hypothetical protein
VFDRSRRIVFKDECLNGPEGSATCERILRAIGGPVGQAEAVRCQMSAAARDSGSGRLAACASCNDVLLEPDDVIIDAGPVGHLHAAFTVTDDLALRGMPGALVARHVCALHMGGQ